MKYIIETHKEGHGILYFCGLVLLAGKETDNSNFWTLKRKAAYKIATPELAVAITNLLKCLPEAAQIGQIQVEEVE